ncbi:hypothetical protein C2G38_2127486 [Gigaspora rosea]|uniref:Uncharacterized protein n=1 Tax=Gigaspora rosea TaxID=44941 RepID=A0A397U346_9GLOM|nr:hypothetical protein C2G38_2127486 [Gigaspora rosea]
MLDAEELFDVIACDINITTSLPDDVKQYLEELLSGDIVSALGKLDKPLVDNPSQLLLWTREVSRHFIFYYHYGGLQVNCNETTWSIQTIYRLLDLFSVFLTILYLEENLVKLIMKPIMIGFIVSIIIKNHLIVDVFLRMMQLSIKIIQQLFYMNNLIAQKNTLYHTI